jgi:hypothetical protein
MANANIPRGLQPYAKRTGELWTGALRTYYVPVGNATALYLGDPVNLLSTAGSDGNGVPAIGIATAGAAHQILGAYMGRSNEGGILPPITLLQSNNVYLPASTAAYVYVCDDPDLLYWIQEDSVGGAMPSASGGGRGNLVAGTGSNVTAQSGWQLQSSSVTTTGGDSTKQLQIVQALQETDNLVGVNCKWLVGINTGISVFTQPLSGVT